MLVSYHLPGYIIAQIAVQDVPKDILLVVNQPCAPIDLPYADCTSFCTRLYDGPPSDQVQIRD
jgi:hypothetical protein